MTSREQWSRWHPLAREVAQTLVKRDEPDLTADELSETKLKLSSLTDKKALETAVRDLLFLAAALEHEGLSAIAAKIFATVESKVVTGTIDTINRARSFDRAEAIASSAKRFEKFQKHESSARHAPDRKDSLPRGLRPRDLGVFRIAG
jgi:hypothetical protein